ncbi:MAG TPA: hypothetical protein VM261_07595 [Kofleriaceae bacterium]|nr:hypothetical protein [Kofleriaceae bacterium]
MSTTRPSSPPADAPVRVARMLLRAGRAHAAALVLAEHARKGSRDPEAWCALAAALLGARHRLVVKPYERWAAMVLRDAEPIVFATPFAQPTLELMREVAAPTSDDPMDAYALDQLIEWLVTSEDILPDAVAALAGDDRVLAVGLLAESSDHAATVVRAAIEGRFGAAAARAALRRCRRFLQRGDVVQAINAAARSPRRAELEPYLGTVLDELARR